MAKSNPIEVGTRVTRKRDGAKGTLTMVTEPRPGVAKGLVTVHYDGDYFDALGDRGWLRSYFTIGGKA